MLTVELEPELERRAREQASERGQSLSEYLAALIASDTNGHLQQGTDPALRTSSTPQNGASSENTILEEKPAPANLLEFLGDHVGSVRGTGENVSGRVSELFGEYLEEKRRTGRLCP